MKNLIIILVTYFTVLQISSQEVCVSENKTLVDINTVNKCAVVKGENKNKKGNINDITISSKRYFKKRIYLNQTVYLASNLKINLIANIAIINDLDTPFLLVSRRELKVEEIPFDLVEEIPLFASCAEGIVDKAVCFNEEMQKHINTTFQYPEKAMERGIEGEIMVSFIIDKNGKVKNIVTKGNKDHEILKREAKRLVSLLPLFTPGKQNGIVLDVSYSFPMNFSLDLNN